MRLTDHVKIAVMETAHAMKCHGSEVRGDETLLEGMVLRGGGGGGVSQGWNLNTWERLVWLLASGCGCG